MAMLTNNRPTREFEGATRQREIAEARQMAKRANEQAVAAAHRTSTDGQPSVSFERKLTQDGKVS